MTQVKLRGVIPRAHFPRSFGGIRISLSSTDSGGKNAVGETTPGCGG